MTPDKNASGIRARPNNKTNLLKSLVGFATTCVLIWAALISAAAAYTLSGTVYGGGSPLADAALALTDASSGSEIGKTTTAMDGRYGFTVNAGTYNLVVTPPATSNYAPSPVFGIVVGTQDVSQNVVLIAETSPWTGTVKGLGGVALPGVNISLYDSVSMVTRLASSQSDVSGSFVLKVSPGKYRANISGSKQWSYCPGGAANPSLCQMGSLPNGAPESFSWSMTVTVPEGGLSQDLQLPFAELQGKVTDANGVPVAGVAISGSGNYNNNLQGDLAVWGHIVGSAGSNNIVSDANGTYSLWLFQNSSGDQGYAIVVTPDARSNFAITSISGFRITGLQFLSIILPFVDKTPPTIVSGPIFRSLTSSSVVVEWQTDEPSKGMVKAGSVSVSADNLATTHSVQLTGLSPSTLYTAEVSVTDAAGNGPTLKNASFTTAASADLTPPVILEGPTVGASTANGLVVEWTTSEPAKGLLFYGVGGVLSASVAEAGFSVAHRIELTGLASSTEYSVRVSATDAAGNGPALSRIMTGRTLAAADISAPVIVNGPLVSNITESAATVNWKTDEPSTGGVSWNDGVAYGVLTDEKLSTEHSARITGLVAGKTYYLTVSSRDALGNGPTLSKTVDFTTQAVADTTAPVILGGPAAVNITDRSAVIQWETDEPSDSQIVYGANPANLDKSDSRAALTKKHSLTLVGLAPSSTYSVQVRSKDASGNISGYSQAISFTTAAGADTSLPVFDSPPQVGHISTDRALIQWKTSKLTDAQLQVAQDGKIQQLKNVGTQSDAHQVALTGLNANQSYDVTVVSTDLSGNSASQSLGTFSTPPTPDSTAPRITEGPSVVSVSDTQAVVRWVTDELADSRVAYGPANSALSQVIGDIGYRKEHVLVLTKLQANTAYQFQVGSVDPSGNGPTQSAIVSFTTGAQADVTAPQVIVAPTITNLTATTATLTWTTNELSTSVVNYGSTGLTQNTEDRALTNSHSVTLANLTASTHYQFTVSSTDASGNTTTSAPASFDTPAPATLTSITISGVDTLDAGTSAAYSVIATYSDGKASTVSAAWTLRGTAASIDPAQGILSANSVTVTDTVTLTASYEGKTAEKSVSIRPVTGTQATNYLASFRSGWTLAGNGLASPIDVAATFGASAIAANVTTVWSWDAANTTWRFYSPRLSAADLAAYVLSKGYQLLTSIAPREGFWVNASSGFDLPARSALAVSVALADMVTGWNLISTGTEISPPDFNRSLSDPPAASETIPKNFTSLWAWDNPQSNWYFYAPSLDALGSTRVKEYTDSKGYLDFATQNKRLGQGTGFWVNR